MNLDPIFGQVYTFSCFMGRVTGHTKLLLFVSAVGNTGKEGEKASIYSSHSAVNTNIPALNRELINV